MPRTQFYDPRCHDLAAHFLSDHPERNTPERIADLAKEIQATIEFELALMGITETA